MRIDALVPVKAAAAGKERLARALVPVERAALVRAMLRDVVGTLRASPLLHAVAVTSPDAAMLALAEAMGARALPEPADVRGLNGALAAGIARLAADGAEAVLIVQGDVPEISLAEIGVMVAPPLGARLVRAVPSADGGTSALLLFPPTVIAPAFGPDSFARHADAAPAAGAAFERCELTALAWDIDRPEDIERLVHGGRDTHTRRLLVEIGVAERMRAVGTCDAE
ncbi:MAG: 2-phospho-L-lactate guanylyltransferase [Chloroflexi bacterium]|nr:2-phospho-L-lactate guanylyltransferase [Chloroflexota bacterium]